MPFASCSLIGWRRAIVAIAVLFTLPRNNEWRAASKAKDAEKRAAAQKAIEECEAEIQAAVQPVALKFEIAK
jgi:hypothetical protein